MSEKEECMTMLLDSARRLREFEARPPRVPTAFDGMFPLVVNPFLPEHLDEGYEEVVRFPAHPLVVWLSRYFRIEPYTELRVVRRRNVPFPVYLYAGTLYVHSSRLDLFSGGGLV